MHMSLLHGCIDYIKRNEDRFYIILAVLIFTEGVVLLEYRVYWWIPLIAVPALGAVLLIWKNHRVIIKVLISIIVVIIASAFSMLSATSFSNSASSGIAAPLGIISGAFLFILCSYCFDTNASRWTALQVATIAAFIVSYSFIVLGSVAMMVSSIITMMVVGSLWMLLANAWNRRSSGMPVRPRNIQGYMTEKMREALGNGWNVAVSDTKYPFHVAVKDDDDRLFVFVPLDFAHRLYVHRKRGIVYRNRKVGEYFYKVLSYARHKTDENAVILIEDWTGTSESYETMAIPVKDSESSHEYTRIIDMSQNNSDIRNDIQDIMDTFDYKGISEKRSSHIMDSLSKNNKWKKDNK